MARQYLQHHREDCQVLLPATQQFSFQVRIIKRSGTEEFPYHEEVWLQPQRCGLIKSKFLDQLRIRIQRPVHISSLAPKSSPLALVQASPRQRVRMASVRNPRTSTINRCRQSHSIWKSQRRLDQQTSSPFSDFRRCDPWIHSPSSTEKDSTNPRNTYRSVEYHQSKYN